MTRIFFGNTVRVSTTIRTPLVLIIIGTCCESERIETTPIYKPIFLLPKKNRPGDEASLSPDISVDSHVILYEWVCDE